MPDEWGVSNIALNIKDRFDILKFVSLEAVSVSKQCKNLHIFEVELCVLQNYQKYIVGDYFELGKKNYLSYKLFSVIDSDFNKL